MCIAYLSLGVDPQWPVFIAANRDEFHARPSRFAAPWEQAPEVIAGLDLQAGGTWLGVSLQGRFGLLTNYREPGAQRSDAPSRGALVSNYLLSDQPAQAYVDALHAQAQSWNGFNLIVGDLQSAWYLGNRTREPGARHLHGKTHVLSNHLLDTPWPKAERLRRALDAFPLDRLPERLDEVFDILKDGTKAEDAALPRTGLETQMERLLSSPFIVSPEYGTRCSTVIAIRRDGQAWLSEISYDATGTATERHDWPFAITAG